MHTQFQNLEDLPYLTSGTVTELSAMFVDRIIWVLKQERNKEWIKKKLLNMSTWKNPTQYEI